MNSYLQKRVRRKNDSNFFSFNYLLMEEAMTFASDTFNPVRSGAFIFLFFFLSFFLSFYLS
jgi:hypothetical protein